MFLSSPKVLNSWLSLSIFLQEGVKEEGSRVRAVLMFMNFVGNDFISNRFVCKRFTVQTLLWSTECDNRKRHYWRSKLDSKFLYLIATNVPASNTAFANLQPLYWTRLYVTSNISKYDLDVRYFINFIHYP